MAKAYGVSHKCAIPIAGVPMLQRVARTLIGHPKIGAVTISIDIPAIAREALGDLAAQVRIVPSAATAAASAINALQSGGYPVLITTGDHPLLTGAMLDDFLGKAGNSGADLCVGLATAETIMAAFPETKRTFLTFGPDRVSGCNLYALMSRKAEPALTFWSALEKDRKKPWRLVGAFGLIPLLRFATGAINLDKAFAMASQKLGLNAKPILLPFAEASIDVDKPADKELVEKILSRKP
jgi:GTP:adenosylcobinamide-phosphate guanylyltransferase